jgi:hypothetical protein
LEAAVKYGAPEPSAAKSAVTKSTAAKSGAAKSKAAQSAAAQSRAQPRAQTGADPGAATRNVTAPNVVDVWRIDLKAVAHRVAALDAYLSNDERERAGRFRAHLDRTRWVAYRAALRIILGGYLNVTPSEVAYTAGGNGKPQVAAPAARLTFNGSHSGDVALVTVAPGFEVGIDVEMVCARADVDAVGRRFFSAR